MAENIIAAVAGLDEAEALVHRAWAWACVQHALCGMSHRWKALVEAVPTLINMPINMPTHMPMPIYAQAYTHSYKHTYTYAYHMPI